ncbi:MAG: cysteine desulfurase family protein [Actinomycetes bacterium]
MGGVSGGYFDHAATTPLRPQARAALVAELDATGNASSLHASGRRARKVVEESRESIAAELGVRPSEVVFTSGGTEADNLAVKGTYWARRDADPEYATVLVSAIEHHAVLDPVRWLARSQGARVVELPVGPDGCVDPQVLERELIAHDGTVALVSVMSANNETGMIQPIERISTLCQRFGVPLHSDAVQSVGWYAQPDAAAPRPDLLTVSAHKFGGPIGVGALVVRGQEVVPLLHGGGQQNDARSGTLMTAQIAAMAAALAAAAADRDRAVPQVADLRDSLIRGVLEVLPDTRINGSTAEPRLPNIAALAFPDAAADALLMLLDVAGIECSAGSACTAGVSRPSHVLAAMGVSPELARGSLRFSLGWDSTARDVDRLLTVLPDAVARARRAQVGGRTAVHRSSRDSRL